MQMTRELFGNSRPLSESLLHRRLHHIGGKMSVALRHANVPHACTMGSDTPRWTSHDAHVCRKQPDGAWQPRQPDLVQLHKSYWVFIEHGVLVLRRSAEGGARGAFSPSLPALRPPFSDGARERNVR